MAGKRVDTEEDVLHLTNLPTFDGLLRPSESELLLTYLTAPYLRVPLVLRHFADAQRVRHLHRRAIFNENAPPRRRGVAVPIKTVEF